MRSETPISSGRTGRRERGVLSSAPSMGRRSSSSRWNTGSGHGPEGVRAVGLGHFAADRRKPSTLGRNPVAPSDRPRGQSRRSRPRGRAPCGREIEPEARCARLLFHVLPGTPSRLQSSRAASRNSRESPLVPEPRSPLQQLPPSPVLSGPTLTLPSIILDNSTDGSDNTQDRSKTTSSELRS
jgi:hypothetical protein